MIALVVDDDRVLSDVLAFTLRKEGFQVQQVYDGAQALARIEQEPPDLVVLDVNLPGMDGFDVCARVRAFSDVPILLLTVRADEDDIVRGLNAGADDYILKPFSPRQLTARAQAVLRRSGKAPSAALYTFHALTFDPARRALAMPGEDDILLTRLESRLFESLCRPSGHFIPVAELIHAVWGYEQADGAMLRQLVRRLRARLDQLPECPVTIENLPGEGYGLFPR